MPALKSNKARLYLGVYGTTDSDLLEYAFIVAPKIETSDPRILDATKYHCCRTFTHTMSASSSKKSVASTTSSRPNPWVFEKLPLNVNTNPDLLVRICVGKLDNDFALEKALSKVPVSQNDPDFTAEWWMQMAWSQLQHEQVLTKESSWTWETLTATATEYLQEKTKTGRISMWKSTRQNVPTYDMMSARELST